MLAVILAPAPGAVRTASAQAACASEEYLVTRQGLCSAAQTAYLFVNMHVLARDPDVLWVLRCTSSRDALMRRAASCHEDCPHVPTSRASTHTSDVVPLRVCVRKPGYKAGSMGTNSCPGGFDRMSSLNDCRAAAKAVKWTLKSAGSTEVDGDIPKAATANKAATAK